MKYDKLINIGIPILCGVLLIGIVTLIFIQIILRQFFDCSLAWSDEISQFCLTWLVLFGSIWAIKNDQHMNTGLKIHQKLNKRQISLIDGVLALFIAVIAAVIFYQTAIFTFQQWNRESISFQWLKMGWIFMVVPFSMMAVIYYNLKKFYHDMKLTFKKDSSLCSSKNVSEN
jgi:TRAP-type C4-dicarboxylate transport system permease small subunit